MFSPLPLMAQIIWSLMDLCCFTDWLFYSQQMLQTGLQPKRERPSLETRVLWLVFCFFLDIIVNTEQSQGYIVTYYCLVVFWNVGQEKRKYKYTTCVCVCVRSGTGCVSIWQAQKTEREREKLSVITPHPADAKPASSSLHTLFSSHTHIHTHTTQS